LIGVIGYFLAARAMFLATAVLVIPALLALAWMRPADIHYGQSVGAPDHHELIPPPQVRRLTVCKRHGLLIPAVVCSCSKWRMRQFYRWPAKRWGIASAVSRR
jgi:hypothetical protein